MLEPFSQNQTAFRVIAAYKFVRLDELPQLKAELFALCTANELRGTILLSPEGINLFIGGEVPHVEAFVATLRAMPAFEGIEVKESESSMRPFKRMLIKIKSQIICFNDTSIDPSQRTSPKLPPKTLKEWLDEGRPLTLLDTRNEYEVRIGTFAGAVDPGITNFRDLPQAIERLPQSLKDEPVVIFCTGGIRCEKAGPYLEQQGFKKVYQLEGGILKYFEECGGAHYEGECFVFDDRVAVDPQLRERNTSTCSVCGAKLTPQDLRHPHYIWEKSCEHCFAGDAKEVSGN